MKPAKPRSATMNEQTFVPPSMRALYYSLVPSMDIGTNETTPDDTSTRTKTAPSPTTGLVLDTDFPTPLPSANQYLLKVQTAAFCQDEQRLATALNPHKTTPQIPLHSVCGTVLFTPRQDHDRPLGSRYKIGDVVFGLLSYTRDGGAADYTLATDGELALKPSNVSAAEAAALALPALTAWQALFLYAGLDPDAPANGNGNGHRKKSGSGNGNGHGDEHENGNGNGNKHRGWRSSIGSGSGNSNGQGWRNGNGFLKKKVPPLRVLVTNARDSEVGRIAVQLLRAEKLFPPTVRPWICISCTAAEEEVVRHDWDVDEVLVIPHLPAENECDIGGMFRAKKWDPVDLVLDCTGSEVFRRAHEPSVVKEYGAVLTVVDPRPAQEPAKADEQDVLGRRKRGLRSRFVPVNPDSAALTRIVELVEGHMVRGREEQVVDLVNAAELLDAGAAGAAGSRRGGMMVVRVN